MSNNSKKMSDWINTNTAKLKGLQGSSVERWFCAEMALRETGADGLPQWNDESVPYLQLGRLDLQLSNGKLSSIITYQNDDQFGLCYSEELPPLELGSTEAGSIFRNRELEELPIGKVDSVSVSFDRSGDISDVEMQIGEHRVSLKAGEFYEQWDGSLELLTMDESILVQVDGERPIKRMIRTR
jgi:hypothetical protein